MIYFKMYGGIMKFSRLILYFLISKCNIKYYHHWVKLQIKTKFAVCIQRPKSPRRPLFSHLVLPWKKFPKMPAGRVLNLISLPARPAICNDNQAKMESGQWPHCIRILDRSHIPPPTAHRPFPTTPPRSAGG